MTEKIDTHDLVLMTKAELAQKVVALEKEISALKRRLHIPDVAPSSAIFKPLDMPDPSKGGY